MMLIEFLEQGNDVYNVIQYKHGSSPTLGSLVGKIGKWGYHGEYVFLIEAEDRKHMSDHYLSGTNLFRIANGVDTLNKGGFHESK